MPSLFGNFAEIQKVLVEAAPKEDFSFAVFGDTEGTSTFKLLAQKLRAHPVDFAVHLGDAFDARTYPFFRAQLGSDLALPFPVFFLPGNQDMKAVPLVQFEEVFGPSLFSFIYQDCLFVGLGFAIAENIPGSLQYLEETLNEAGGRYAKTFVFMHLPPKILPGNKFDAPEEFIALFNKYKVDYVFSGHYHGYAHVAKGGTTYIVSGAAGKYLEETPYGQFHHGLIIKVGRDYVSEIIVPIAGRADLENKLQRLAIVELYPWFLQNRELAVIATLIVVLLAMLTVKALSGRKR
ncbi:MAG: metallophosphoesterase [Proteobacteria bacterium]|nr:metallophosphoesterase [Pseudomonadota bacterium]